MLQILLKPAESLSYADTWHAMQQLV